MAGERVYLDYNATAPVLPGARSSAIAAMDLLGNPSSVHTEGRLARGLIEQARESVATLAGADPDKIVFTSGGTEAANLALRSAQSGLDRPALLMSAGEHPCVLEGHGCSQADVKLVPLGDDGRIDLGQLRILAASCEQPLVAALQAANNETGVIQPVAEAAEIVHAAGGLLICDAVQAPGRMDIADHCSNADYVVLSAHKAGGIKGAGALVCMRGAPDAAAALVRGGGQERGLRAGTENVSAIAAFGAASEWANESWRTESERLAALRDQFERELQERYPQAVIFGAASPRLPNTSSFALADASAETLLIALDLAGIAVSSGSACSSGKVKSSHVLDAMGIAPGIAKGAIRVSLGHASAEQDIDGLLAGLDGSLAKMGRRAIAAAA